MVPRRKRDAVDESKEDEEDEEEVRPSNSLPLVMLHGCTYTKLCEATARWSQDMDSAFRSVIFWLYLGPVRLWTSEEPVGRDEMNDFR
jgi:hypothetical protein